MNQRLHYELLGLAYWAECANPFRNTVTARHLPLGLRMQGYKRDALGRNLYRRGIHEPGLTKLLIDTFADSPGSNFLDVGANAGYFSCILGKLAGPTGKVIAIEPEPQNRQLIARNLASNGLKNVTLLPYAVGAEDGTAKMGIYKPANRGRHSLVDLEPCKKFIDVPVRRLDDLVRDANVTEWALMKLDVEGFEPFVFAGAPETLSRTKILAMEYAPSYWRKAGIEPATVFQKLSAYFTQIHHFKGSGLELFPISPEECVRSEVILDLVLRP
jgi:FkbM family methyltransferase